jgi:hypothetical protein
MFGHFGAFGLFLLATIDSSPLPTFGGPDLLTAILAAQQSNPSYEYSAVAAVIGTGISLDQVKYPGRPLEKNRTDYQRSAS